MGTKQWGSSATPGGGTYYFTPSNAAVKANNNPVTSAEDGWVDAIYVFCGAHNGGNSLFKFGLYGTGGHIFGSETSGIAYGTGYGWNKGVYPASGLLHVFSGQSFVAGVIASGQALQVQGYNDGGNFDWWNAGSAVDLQNPWVATATIGTVGNIGWYATYFPTATVTGVPSAPIAPGSTFTVTGTSFSSGVTSVSIGGVACSGVTVVNDTTLTAVAPTQGVTGTVQVATNAGTGTSSATVQVGQIFYGSGSSVPLINSIWYGTGSGVAKIVAAWVPSGSGVKRIW